MTLERDTLLLNRYKIVETLGQGGMGAVYRAIDENLGVEIALKENLFTSDEYSRQFRREATILASLRHPNLPRVSDHFEVEDQGQYLVMDYIEGEDLRQRMDRVGILQDEEVIVIGAAICDALEYLHTREPTILHRDIKPGNIKIDPEGGIFLVDFGLAKIVSGSDATTTGARAMTPGYSSPEQYGTARTDARSDIYSLGATLYAALTGIIPEDGLARAMEQADLTPIRKRNPRVSRRLVNVIEKALEIHPDDRYQSGYEFKEALLNASSATRSRVEGGDATVSPPPAEYIAAIAEGRLPSSSSISQPSINMSGESLTRIRRRQRQKLNRTVSTIIAVVLISIIVTSSYFFTNGFTQAPLALLAVDDVSPSATATETMAATFTQTPTFSSTSTLLPTDTQTPTITPTFEDTPTLTSSPTSTETLTPTPLMTSTRIPTLTPLTGPSPTPTEPFVPDPTPVGGTSQLAIASDRSGVNQIWIIDTDGNEVKQVTDIPTGACGPDWSPDGTQIVFISPCQGQNEIFRLTSRLWLINADGSGLIRLWTEAGSFEPAWSPDGSSILYTRAYDTLRAQIFRYDLEDNQSYLMTDNEKLNMHPAWSPDGERIIFTSNLGSNFRLYTIPNVPGAEPELYDRSINMENRYPVYTVDGIKVIFTQKNLSGGFPQLYSIWVDVPRTTSEYFEERIIKVNLSAPEIEPAISPDGNWIAFESWPDGSNHDIYMVDNNGEEVIRITTEVGNDFDPDWRPWNDK
jgi:serine/threonine protein kinase/Tol biopolymer transport system component